ATTTASRQDPAPAPATPPARSGPLAVLRGVLARPLASYYLLLASSGLLLVIGLVMVFSATSVQAYSSGGNAYSYVTKQAVFSLVGLVPFWIFRRLPARPSRALGLPLLISSILLLLLLDLLGVLSALQRHQVAFGPVHADTRNSLWLYLGPLQVQ